MLRFISVAVGLLCLMLAAYSTATNSTPSSLSPEIIAENNKLIIASEEVLLSRPDGDIPLFAMMNQLTKVIECGNLNLYWNANSQECVAPGPGPQGKVIQALRWLLATSNNKRKGILRLLGLIRSSA